MASAEVLGADVANVCRMQLRIEEGVHACLHQKCELVETESSNWLLKSQAMDMFVEMHQVGESVCIDERL
jgi:hypothetical protein